MENFPARLYRARELGEMDRRAANYGLPAVQLMARAGQAAYQAITERWPDARRWLVYAGGGNNGGDGYVVARLALRSNREVVVAALKPPQEGSPAAVAAAAYCEAGGQILALSEGNPAGADVVVDALFGTGLGRAPEGPAAEAIRAINAAAAPVAALDLPSGLFADTGAAPGPTIRAELTVTFIALKLGLFTGAGPALAGQLVFAALGVPVAVEEGLLPAAWRIEPALAAAALPRRSRGAHKGDFGHVLIVGGDYGTGGAVRLAGEAALRTGAGLVSVLTRPEHVRPLMAARPELMGHATFEGELPEPLASRATVIALGPGLGQAEWGRRLWHAALALDKPAVVDADGLNLLAAEPRIRANWVLTPHPGEAAHLLDTTIADIENDRPAAVKRLSERYQAVAVLKGVGTMIAEPGQDAPWLCDRGNPGMASGGMGDALTGVIAGLLAQGLAPPLAARLGVWLHASAGDRAGGTTERGLLASDLIAELRGLVNP
ncbi:MAG: NAD(P)H-hydrate dehydratase [Gammaproteobacteria bacterium]